MIYKSKISKLLLMALLLMVAMLAVACGQPAEPQVIEKTVVVEVEVEKEVEKIVEKEVEVVVTQIVEVEKEEPELEELPYGLTPGKPYEGTELNFLICCATAPQFANLNQRSQEEFFELTGIKVTWGDAPFAEFQSKIIAEATAGSSAFDVFAYVDAWGPSIQQYLEPLDGYIERDGWDLENYPGAYLRAGEGFSNGVRYGLPFRGHPFMFFYRQDVFDELGLEAPTTWEELEAAAEVIKAETDLDPISAYYGINAGQNLFMWESFLWSNGGDILDENYEPIFNSPEGVEATQRYIDLLNNELTGPGSVAFNEQEANAEYNQGRAAMFIGWWWMYSRMTNCETNPAEVCENSAFAPTPGWEGKDAASYGHIWQVSINQFGRNKEAAWEFMKWMLNEEIEKAVVLDDSDPSVDTNVAVRLSVLDDDEVNEAHGGLQRVGAKVLESARTQVMLPEWPEMLSILEVAINDMAANGTDVQETLDQAADDIRDIMERGGYYDE